jgi:hypothetical protein
MQKDTQFIQDGGFDMDKINYCLECRKIFISENLCTNCNSSNIKELAMKSPVNIIGTKTKGRFLGVKQGQAEILFTDESKNQSVKCFDISKIKKIL